jgi:hypothetical protein
MTEEFKKQEKDSQKKNTSHFKSPKKFEIQVMSLAISSSR